MKNFVLELNSIVKNFGTKLVLNQLNLAIKHGEVYGLLGANGAGKSTTVRLICGLLQADAGTAYCLGQKVGKPISLLGYMPQIGSLYNDLTVIEHLFFFAGIHGLNQIEQRVDQLLAQYGLLTRKHERVGNLSGGWRQRLAFVVSIIHEPRLLLLDEPSAGLDPSAREQLWQSIRALTDLQGVTVLVTTHYLEEASRCDRIGYLAHGHLMAEGEPHALAKQLSLSTWHISQVNANNSAQLFEKTLLERLTDCIGFNRVSNGWRLTCPQQTLLPQAILDSVEDYHATINQVETDLADTLTWLAREAAENSKPIAKASI
jgi:ABC-2 type transport system ATP-binding protein